MFRTLAVLFSAAIMSAPLAAQSVDFGIWANSTILQGDNRVDDVSDVEIDFDEEIGWGASVDLFWTPRFSTELAAYSVEAGGSMNIGILDEQIDLGTLNVTPVTLTLRAHFGGDRADFYAGAGGAWAMFDDLQSADLEIVGVDAIEIDDEFTWLVNAGTSIRLTQSLRIGADAKWIPLEATGVDTAIGDAVPLELDPLVLSVGLIWRP